jgi:NADPH:quinone reductase-like Zn-dependent oxidoreductase
MKAAQIKKYGDASVVQINEIDKPKLGEGQVLVEVHASSINPVDVVIRSGMMQQMAPLSFPVTLGGDIAGIVSEVSGGVSSVAVSDKVYGQANAVAGNSGAFAEFAATSAGQVAKAPNNIDYNQAASLPLVGVSALQALTEHIKLAPGQKILITGGSGGIGSIAIQIAKHLGANITTTATGEGLELAKQLGADTVLDYKSQELSELSKDYDAVFDTVGGDMFNGTLHLLKPSGIGVSMIAQADESLVKKLNVKAMTQRTQITTEALTKLSHLVESGIVRPQVGQVFSLDDIVGAFKAKENDTVTGKIVVEIKNQ